MLLPTVFNYSWLKAWLFLPLLEAFSAVLLCPQSPCPSAACSPQHSDAEMSEYNPCVHTLRLKPHRHLQQESQGFEGQLGITGSTAQKHQIILNSKDHKMRRRQFQKLLIASAEFCGIWIATTSGKFRWPKCTWCFHWGFAGARVLRFLRHFCFRSHCLCQVLKTRGQVCHLADFSKQKAAQRKQWRKSVVLSASALIRSTAACFSRLFTFSRTCWASEEPAKQPNQPVDPEKKKHALEVTWWFGGNLRPSEELELSFSIMLRHMFLYHNPHCYWHNAFVFRGRSSFILSAFAKLWVLKPRPPSSGRSKAPSSLTFRHCRPDRHTETWYRSVNLTQSEY